jgi:elongation factor P hydroxylase
LPSPLSPVRLSSETLNFRPKDCANNHSIAWSIAGEKRRLLPDLGYWYAPDGRTQEQQSLFEQVTLSLNSLPSPLSPVRLSSETLNFRPKDCANNHSIMLKCNVTFRVKLSCHVMQQHLLVLFANVHVRVHILETPSRQC